MPPPTPTPPRRSGPAWWADLPTPVRRVIAAVAGTLLISLGAALVWLPGPFTLPLVIAGVAVLSTEYVWARTWADKGGKIGRATKARLSNPWLLVAALLTAAAVTVAGYTWWNPGWWHTAA